MPQGAVKFYDERKHFGRIVYGDGREVYVHVSQLGGVSGAALVEGEPVDFEIEPNDRGGEAVQVKRLEERVKGKVAEYDRAKGWGYATADGNERRYWFHYTFIVGGGRTNLEPGDAVEFVLGADDQGRPQAHRVKRLDSRFALERFVLILNRDERMEELAELAQDEDWDYKYSGSAEPKPVLRSYVYYTFDRLEDEGKIEQSTDSDGQPIACFNTGLVTQLQEQIFAYMTPNRQQVVGGPPWFLHAFLAESDRRMTFFAKRPDIADYFEDPAELIYDTRVDLIVDIPHIIQDNRDRFPEKLRDNEFVLRSAVEGALNAAKRRVRGNYKTAIPQFYQGKLQLLLPLCLQAPNRADLALVVERGPHVYYGPTVLPLDAAYRNARLIARPDREWLQP